MPECEICGKSAVLTNATIDGIKLRVCKDCAPPGQMHNEPEPEDAEAPAQGSHSGKISFYRPYKTPASTSQKAMERDAYQSFKSSQDVEVELADDFGQRIKKAREARGLKQEELAQQIKEHVSIIHKLETGKHRPNEVLAKKLEKFLLIKLYEEV